MTTRLRLKPNITKKTKTKRNVNIWCMRVRRAFIALSPYQSRADVDGVKAHFEKGVLQVATPYKELPQPKKVTIEAKMKPKK